MYIYTTRDLAVDLVSPLAAYKLVTLALKQENPVRPPARVSNVAIASIANRWDRVVASFYNKRAWHTSTACRALRLFVQPQSHLHAMEQCRWLI